MHKIFGIKKNVEYLDREGVYVIPIRNNQVGVIQTAKGYFLLGGGLENAENHITCIERECMEETGYEVCVKELVCSAEAYVQHSTIGYFHPIQTYYVGELILKIAEPIERDHEFHWIEYDKVKGKMFVEMQNWALEQCFNYMQNRFQSESEGLL